MKIGQMREMDDDLLIADFKKRVVSTNCGDFYLDYEISFDDLFKFVDYIKKCERELK